MLLTLPSLTPGPCRTEAEPPNPPSQAILARPNTHGILSAAKPTMGFLQEIYFPLHPTGETKQRVNETPELEFDSTWEDQALLPWKAFKNYPSDGVQKSFFGELCLEGAPNLSL